MCLGKISWAAGLEKNIRLVGSNLSQFGMSEFNSNPTGLGMVLLFKKHLEGLISGGQRRV